MQQAVSVFGEVLMRRKASELFVKSQSYEKFLQKKLVSFKVLKNEKFWVFLWRNFRPEFLLGTLGSALPRKNPFSSKSTDCYSKVGDIHNVSPQKMIFVRLFGTLIKQICLVSPASEFRKAMYRYAS